MGRIVAIGAAFVATIILLAGGAAITVVQAVFGSSSRPSDTALADIPPDFLALYQLAARVCPGLNWSILAAIGKIETNHGRLQAQGVWSGENPWGAGGVMQILQPTWNEILAQHQIPPGGATPPSRYNKHDAIHAAAFYLCDKGARDGRDLRAAIFAYNRANWYVDRVLAQATKYAQAQLAAPSEAAAKAIAFARAQIGQPYVWGGNGNIDGGFDCSGLTTAAYSAAGIRLPRTAHTQYHATARVSEAELQPGDLVFYGNPNTKIHHVGLYIGNGQMIDAPTFGKVVGIHPIRYRGDDFTTGGRVK